MANELKAMARSLQTNTLDPWRELVKITEAPDLDDGWAHSGDDSLEGMLRELNGMMSDDRHERVFAAFDAQERQRAEKKQSEIVKRIESRGGPGFFESSITPMTEAQVQARAAALRQGRMIMPVSDDVVQSSPMDRLTRYK